MQIVDRNEKNIMVRCDEKDIQPFNKEWPELSCYEIQNIDFEFDLFSGRSTDVVFHSTTHDPIHLGDSDNFDIEKVGVIAEEAWEFAGKKLLKDTVFDEDIIDKLASIMSSGNGIAEKLSFVPLKIQKAFEIGIMKGAKDIDYVELVNVQGTEHEKGILQLVEIMSDAKRIIHGIKNTSVRHTKDDSGKIKIRLAQMEEFEAEL